MASSNDPTTQLASDRRPAVRVTMLLADAAQVADGKLYILGGGITAMGPRPQPIGIAIRSGPTATMSTTSRLWHQTSGNWLQCGVRVEVKK